MKLYFPALDSLRFFASLNIVLLHFSTSSLLSYAKETVFEPLIKGPFFNTSMFFLLSGFIYAVLFNKEERIPKLKPFLKERFWRLYPLHIISTLIVFAIIVYRTHHLDNPIYAIQSLALHVSLLWAFVPNLGHALNQPSWALTVFFLCYALTPVFAKFLNRQNKNATIWLMFFFTWALLASGIIYFEKLPNILRGIVFFSGMLLGKLFLKNAIPLPKTARLNDLLLLLTAILLYANICWFKPLSSGFCHHITSPLLYCAILILLANNKGLIVRIFSVSWIRELGKISFYVYLLHCVAIQFLHLYLSKVVQWKYNPFNNFKATVIIIILLYGSCIAYKAIVQRFSKRSSKMH